MTSLKMAWSSLPPPLLSTSQGFTCSPYTTEADDFVIRFKEVDDFMIGDLGGGYFLINENQENIPLHI